MLSETKRVKRTRLERVYRTRIDNLRSMIRVYGSQAALGRALGVGATHMTHIIGENPIKSIGESAARDYETKLNLPAGWLDTAR